MHSCFLKHSTNKRNWDCWTQHKPPSYLQIEILPDALEQDKRSILLFIFFFSSCGSTSEKKLLLCNVSEQTVW